MVLMQCFHMLPSVSSHPASQLHKSSASSCCPAVSKTCFFLIVTKSTHSFLSSVFKNTVQWHSVHSQCCTISTTIHSWNFLVFPNWNPIPVKQPLVSPPPFSFLYKFGCSGSLLRVIRQYLSFCDWLILLHIMPLGFIQVVTCVKISSFLGWIILYCML